MSLFKDEGKTVMSPNELYSEIEKSLKSLLETGELEYKRKGLYVVVSPDEEDEFVEKIEKLEEENPGYVVGFYTEEPEDSDNVIIKGYIINRLIPRNKQELLKILEDVFIVPEVYTYGWIRSDVLLTPEEFENLPKEIDEIRKKYKDEWESKDPEVEFKTEEVYKDGKKYIKIKYYGVSPNTPYIKPIKMIIGETETLNDWLGS